MPPQKSRISYFNPRTRTECDHPRIPMFGGSEISIHAPHEVRHEAFSNFTVPPRFQSTHPHWVRRSGPPGSRVSAYFNPRTHTRCDLILLVVPSTVGYFNPRTRTRCDSGRPYLSQWSFGFQSTHPHEVRQSHACASISPILFQSTHPHRVRRGLVRGDAELGEISIHAPARGVTRGCRPKNRGFPISIHPPAWGVTRSGRRSRHVLDISIHPPARGVTEHYLSLPFSPIISIHTLGRGVTSPDNNMCRPSRHFNPHTRMGCDRPHPDRSPPLLYFNPRTRTGCDWDGDRRQAST